MGKTDFFAISYNSMYMSVNIIIKLLYLCNSLESTLDINLRLYSFGYFIMSYCCPYLDSEMSSCTDLFSIGVCTVLLIIFSKSLRSRDPVVLIIVLQGRVTLKLSKMWGTKVILHKSQKNISALYSDYKF